MQPQANGADTGGSRSESSSLLARSVTVRFEGLTAVDMVDEAVYPGEIVGLIGPNGAGKTTLVNAMTGFQRPAAGDVLLDGRSVTRVTPHKLRRQGVAVETRPDVLFLNAVIARKKLAPKPAEHFPFSITYGYHFESAKLGHFLRDRAKAMGVNHVIADVVEVKQAESGDIASVETRCGQSLAGDCFVDCSGFRGMLIQQTLGSRFISFEKNLFNDSAIAIPTPIDDDIPCQTESNAMKHGWAWKIPLRNRYGNGYVYSSEYCSHDDAETEIREHLGLLDDDVEARRVPMKVGRLAENWKKNCVAVGLSRSRVAPGATRRSSRRSES